MKTRKIRIAGDGTPLGTTITDAETGEIIPCRSVSFSVDAEKTEALVTIVIDAWGGAVDLDITADAAVEAREVT